jgi:hypothetical protein
VKGGRSAADTARPNKELGRQLGERLGSKVVVKQSAAGKGRIEIAFRNEEELKRLVEVLG